MVSGHYYTLISNTPILKCNLNYTDIGYLPVNEQFAAENGPFRLMFDRSYVKLRRGSRLLSHEQTIPMMNEPLTIDSCLLY